MSIKPKTIIPEKLIGYKHPKKEVHVTNQDAILYSLGIGFSEDPLNQSDLNFTYENADNFKCFPTHLSTFAVYIGGFLLSDNPYLPNYNMMTALHGEQSTEVYQSFTPDSKIYIESEILDVDDKGSGTVLFVGTLITDEEGKILSKIKSSYFIGDIKGHGYKSKGPLKSFSIVSKIPKEAKLLKESIVETKKNQAILYRLGGNDLNPLHIDKNLSKLGGFDTPILHGMCFYGIGCKSLYENFAIDDVDKIKSYNARFTSFVYPGETLIISFYGYEGKILISMKTKERNKQVLIGEAILNNVKF